LCHLASTLVYVRII